MWVLVYWHKLRTYRKEFLAAGTTAGEPIPLIAMMARVLELYRIPGTRYQVARKTMLVVSTTAVNGGGNAAAERKTNTGTQQ